MDFFTLNIDYFSVNIGNAEMKKYGFTAQFQISLLWETFKYIMYQFERESLSQKKKGKGSKDRENRLHINSTSGKQNFQNYLMYKGDLPTISRLKLWIYKLSNLKNKFVLEWVLKWILNFIYELSISCIQNTSIIRYLDDTAFKK